MESAGSMIIEKYYAIKLENNKYLDPYSNEEGVEPIPISLLSDAKRFCPDDGYVEEIEVRYQPIWKRSQ